MRWLLIIGSSLFLLGVQILSVQNAGNAGVLGHTEQQLNEYQAFEHESLLSNAGTQTLLEEHEDDEPLHSGQFGAVQTTVRPNHQRSKPFSGLHLSFKSHYPPPEN